MGQQQLLLLVLGIVIVGLAVVAGINAFEENQEKSTKDAMVSEGIRIATDIKAHRLEPTAYGGGGGTEWPDDLEDAGFETTTDVNTYGTPWGPIVYGGNGSPATLELQPNGLDETATIEIPENGSPSLSTGNGDIWS